MQHHARNHNSNARNAQLDHPARKAQTARWDHEARTAKPDQHHHPVHQADQDPAVPLVTLADQDQPDPAACPADPAVMVFADAVPMDRRDHQVDQVHQARTDSPAVVVPMASQDPVVAMDQPVALASQDRPVAKAQTVVRDCPATMPHTARAHRGRPSSSASTKCHQQQQQQPDIIVVSSCARIHSK
jgi:hypothetical protein